MKTDLVAFRSLLELQQIHAAHSPHPLRNFDGVHLRRHTLDVLRRVALANLTFLNPLGDISGDCWPLVKFRDCLPNFVHALMLPFVRIWPDMEALNQHSLLVRIANANLRES